MTQAHSQSLQRRLSGSHVPLLRTITRNGICTDDVSGKPERYRSMPYFSTSETLSYGDFRPCQQINSGRCKRDDGLANICRTCTPINRTSSEALCRRTFGGRSGQYGLCDGFYDYRPVPVISRAFAAYSIQSTRHRQNSGLSEQSQNAASLNHMCFTQKPLGDRTVFQVDQAKPAHQEFLRNIGKCSQDANLDCGIGICADSNYKKTPEFRDAALHFSTDFVGHGIREDTLAASICGNGLQYEC